MSRRTSFELNPQRKKQYALDLLEFATLHQKYNYIYNGYYFLAYAEKYLGNLPEALKSFYLGYEIAILTSNKAAQGESLLAIAEVYSINKEFEKANLNFKKALDVFRQNSDLNKRELTVKGIAFINYADFLIQNELPDSALVYLYLGEQLFNQINDTYKLAYTVGNIGIAQAQLGNLKEGEERIMEAVAYLEEFNDNYAISEYFLSMSEIYMKRGLMGQAIGFANQSLERALAYQLKEQTRNAYRQLFEIYELVGDHQNALRNHINYTAYKDSLENRENVQKLADLRTEFEVGQKQVEVDLLQAQKKTQQIILLATALFALVLIVLAIVIYQFYRSKNRISMVLAKQKEELERLNHTKDKFFSIISHDLRGPVSAFHGISRMIKMMVNAKKTDELLELAEEIDQSVDRLSSLLDNLLSWALQQQGNITPRPEQVNIKSIAEQISANFQTMAASKQIELTMDVPDELSLYADRNILDTMLRNLVGNALKFTPQKGRVSINAKKNGSATIVSVKDTGVGIPQDKLNDLFKIEAKKSTYGTAGEKGTGLGLQLVDEFARMSGAGLTVQSEPNQGSEFLLAFHHSDPVTS